MEKAKFRLHQRLRFHHLNSPVLYWRWGWNILLQTDMEPYINWSHTNSVKSVLFLLLIIQLWNVFREVPSSILQMSRWILVRYSLGALSFGNYSLLKPICLLLFLIMTHHRSFECPGQQTSQPTCKALSSKSSRDFISTTKVRPFFFCTSLL